jgi:gamma-glutamyltranspeptidase/glutathione hydrolase
MADVFVSYARSDKALVAPLVAAIEAQGWSVWWDPEISPGQEFDRQITAALKTAAAVVVVWTPTSVESRWVRGEARDAAGNAVANTYTLNTEFGSGVVVEGAGFLLNNEMDDFSVKPGVPNFFGVVGADANAIEPGKRMLSSMAPTFLESPRGVAVLGTPGGSRIISMLLLASLAWIDGGDATQMVSLKRYHHQYTPDVVGFEAAAFSEAEQAGLRDRGHRLEPSARPYGNMQVVTWDRASGKVEAASDPRGTRTPWRDRTWLR